MNQELTVFKVSIIIATFNRCELLLRMLQNIKMLSHKNLECIIIDDGSTDETSNKTKDFIANDSRFQYYLRNSNYKKGLPGCRNYGLDLHSGDYVIFFDDDDIVHPQLLEISLKYITSQNVSFVNFNKKPFTDQLPNMVEFQENAAFGYSPFDINDQLLYKNTMASCTVLWDSKVFSSNRFNEELHFAEEWELYSKLLIQNFTGIRLDVVLYYNFKHQDSNTGQFYLNNPVQINSYYQAVYHVVQHLADQHKLTKTYKLYYLNILSKVNFPDLTSLLKNAYAGNYYYWLLVKAFYQIKHYLYIKINK